MPNSIEEQVDEQEISTEEVEEQVAESDAEPVEEHVEEQEDSEASSEEGVETEAEIYEVDVPNGSGGYDTEQININDLPYILAGAKKLQAREAEIEQQQQQLSSYSALLNFVTTDNLTKSIAQYRLQGVSEFEALETIYNYYLQNNLGQASQNEEEDDPRLKALNEKVRKYDEFFENQEKTRNIEENNKFLAQEAINLGYQVDEKDLPIVVEEANKVAYQLFSEIAPDIPPDQFTALRKVTPGIARAIWDETARRLQGRLNNETSRQPSVRKKMAAQKLQQASVTPTVKKKAPTRIISGKKGTDVTAGKASKSAPFVPKGSSSRDRAQALKALFGSVE